MLSGGSQIDGVSNDALTWLIRGGLGASVDHDDFLVLEHGQTLCSHCVFSRFVPAAGFS
jgi:hypothetical protein